QLALDVGDLGLHAVDDGAGVLAGQEHDDGGDGLAAAVSGGGPLANHGGELDVGDVADVDRRAAGVGVEDDLLQLLERAHEADAADDAELAVALEVAAAGVAVVAADGLEDAVDADPARGEALRVEPDLVGLQIAAQHVDLDDAR